MRADEVVEVVTDTEGHRVSILLELSIDDIEELQEVLHGVQEKTHHRTAGELLEIVTRAGQWFRSYLELEEDALRNVNPDEELEEEDDSDE